jgi:hypothetical protein
MALVLHLLVSRSQTVGATESERVADLPAGASRLVKHARGVTGTCSIDQVSLSPLNEPLYLAIHLAVSVEFKRLCSACNLKALFGFLFPLFSLKTP